MQVWMYYESEEDAKSSFNEKEKMIKKLVCLKNESWNTPKEFGWYTILKTTFVELPLQQGRLQTMVTIRFLPPCYFLSFLWDTILNWISLQNQRLKNGLWKVCPNIPVIPQWCRKTFPVWRFIQQKIKCYEEFSLSSEYQSDVFYFPLQFTVLNPVLPKSLTQNKLWSCLWGIHKLCIEPTYIGVHLWRKPVNAVFSSVPLGYLDSNECYSNPSTARGIDFVLGTSDITTLWRMKVTDLWSVGLAHSQSKIENV